jgi:hypothetical protein
VDHLWFEFGDEEEECDAFQRRFLYVVRERAKGWPCPPTSTYVLYFPAEETDAEGRPSEQDELRLVVDLTDQGSHHLAIGASLEGDTVLCSELHVCNLAPSEERDDIVARKAKGSVDELAAFTAEWIGEVLRRPALQYDRRH